MKITPVNNISKVNKQVKFLDETPIANKILEAIKGKLADNVKSDWKNFCEKSGLDVKESDLDATVEYEISVKKLDGKTYAFIGFTPRLKSTKKESFQIASHYKVNDDYTTTALTNEEYKKITQKLMDLDVVEPVKTFKFNIDNGKIEETKRDPKNN